MVKIFIIFLIVIFLLAAMITVAALLRSRQESKESDTFLDENGNHVYYNRSLIKKEQFRRDNPGERNLRTFRRLFSRK